MAKTCSPSHPAFSACGGGGGGGSGDGGPEILNPER